MTALLPAPPSTLHVSAAGSVVAGVLLVAAGLTPVPLEWAVAAACGVGLAFLGLHQPTAAAAIGTAFVICVPFYSGRFLIGSLGLTPMSVVCLVLLPLAFTLRGHVRLRLLDVVVASLVIFRILALAFNYEGGLGGAAAVVLGVALPYAVFRILGMRSRVRLVLAWTVVLTSLPLSLIGLRERAGIPNPFFSFPAQYQAAQWARPEFRGGGVRAEASFGHPIAFGLYLALVLVLSISLAITACGVWQRMTAAAACALALLTLTATLSRGPLLVAMVGVMAWLALTSSRLNLLRVTGVASLLVVAAVATPVSTTVQQLIAASSGDTREARSAQFRLEILRVVVDTDQFSWLGLAAPGAEGISASLAERVALKSIDSEFALAFLSGGLLTLCAMVAVAVLVSGVALRPGLAPVDRAWAVATSASCINLTVVALLTQHAELFWASVGLIAALAQPVPAQETA